MNKYEQFFAERLQDLMNEKGFTKTTLAAELGLPRTTVGSWLVYKRIPQIDALAKLADFFNCTIDYLVGREN